MLIAYRLLLIAYCFALVHLSTDTFACSCAGFPESGERGALFVGGLLGYDVNINPLDNMPQKQEDLWNQVTRRHRSLTSTGKPTLFSLQHLRHTSALEAVHDFPENQSNFYRTHNTGPLQKFAGDERRHFRGCEFPRPDPADNTNHNSGEGNCQ